MEIGITGCSDRLELIKRLGFDFVEPSVYNVSKMSEDEFNLFKKELTMAGLPARAFCLFFPSDIKTTGPEVSQQKIVDYLNHSLNRCKQLGGQTIVYGSGGSRRVPEGYDYDTAWEQLVSFFKTAGEIARNYGITIVIEPLFQKNCNIINRVSEGLSMCRRVDHPNIRLLADNFHMMKENEDPKIILDAGSEYLHHVHLRDIELGFIGEKDREYFDRFFGMLNTIKYKGRLSLEVDVKPSDPKEFERQALECIEFIKSYFK